MSTERDEALGREKQKLEENIAKQKEHIENLKRYLILSISKQCNLKHFIKCSVNSFIDYFRFTRIKQEIQKEIDALNEVKRKLQHEIR